MKSRKFKRAFKRKPGAESPDYDVGYGKPPKHTRFQPGQSGNSGGRPRGALNRNNRIPSINHEHMKLVVRQEVYRTIRVLDGTQPVEIPIIQAIIRSAALHAVKGDRKSQQMIVELLGTIEHENKAAHTEWLDTAIEYKLGWAAELQRRECTGETGPEPIPHPDDIIVNFETNEAEIRGPMTKEEKAQFDGIRTFKVDLERQIQECEDYAVQNPDDQDNLKRIDGLRSIRAKAIVFLSNPPVRTFRLP